MSSPELGGIDRRGRDGVTNVEHAFGLTIPRTLEEVCDPVHTALIVYDMQVGIVSQLPDGSAVAKRVADVRRAARDCGMRVVYTRHMSLPREVAGVTQLRTAMAWQRVERVADVKPVFLRDSPAFQITPELAPAANEVVFDKITMSAFEGTPLAIALRDCGVRALAIAGIALEVGIEPTARHAADLALVPVVVADACGAGNEEAGRRSLAALAFAGDSIITDRATLRRLLDRGS